MDLKKGQRYQASITLSGLEVIATNTMVAEKLTKAGFANVQVSGQGRQRNAVGLWPGSDISNAPIPKQVTEIKVL